MTEHEWLSSADPREMLLFVWDGISERKKRLISCALCRSVWNLLEDEETRHAVTVTEGWCQGKSSQHELVDAAERALAVATEETLRIVRTQLDGRLTPRCYAATAVYCAAGYDKANPIDVADSVWDAIGGASRASQCDIIREVIGNPFCRADTTLSAPRESASWLLAHQICETQLFDSMPILADALEDVGCDAAVLEHCRRPGTQHVLGCWVLDGILGWA